MGWQNVFKALEFQDECVFHDQIDAISASQGLHLYTAPATAPDAQI
jgi:hypothetical protein